MIARVIVSKGPPDALSYAIPEELRASIAPGCRVTVPIRNRKAIGIVVSLDGESVAGIKHISEVIDSQPLISEAQIRLATWISEYYYTGLASALRLFVPSFYFEPDSLSVRRVDSAVEAESEAADLLRMIPPRRAIRVSTLRKKWGRAPGFHTHLTELEVADVISIGCGSRRREDPLIDIVHSNETPPNLGRRQVEILQLLRSNGPIRRSAIVKKLGIKANSLAAILSRGLAAVVPAPDVEGFSVQELILNPEQSAVVETVRESLVRGEFKSYLLHGVTGSGKTEVYVKLIWEALDSGKSAIVLQHFRRRYSRASRSDSAI